MVRVGSLFAGIGGFDLGLERAGMEVVWQVEIDDYCNKILEKHWPDVRRYRDVKEVGKENLEPVDLICGGFPCQPFSVAGKRKGKEDHRHLWPEMFRVIQELKPYWIIGENVVGIINMELDGCISNLENEGYTCQTFIIPACAVNSPQGRDRAWLVAYSDNSRCLYEQHEKHSAKRRESPQHESIGYSGWNTQPDIRRVVNGIPSRLDKDRIKSLGNAVVPQIPEIIGRAIMEIENK